MHCQILIVWCVIPTAVLAMRLPPPLLPFFHAQESTPSAVWNFDSWFAEQLNKLLTPSQDRVKRNCAHYDMEKMFTEACGSTKAKRGVQSQPIRMTVVVVEYLFPPGKAYPTAHYLQNYQEISEAPDNSHQKVTRFPVNLSPDFFTDPYLSPWLLEHHHSENSGTGFIVFIEDTPGGFSPRPFKLAPEPLLSTYRNLRFTATFKKLHAKCCSPTSCSKEDFKPLC